MEAPETLIAQIDLRIAEIVRVAGHREPAVEVVVDPRLDEPAEGVVVGEGAEERIVVELLGNAFHGRREGAGITRGNRVVAIIGIEGHLSPSGEQGRGGGESLAQELNHGAVHDEEIEAIAPLPFLPRRPPPPLRRGPRPIALGEAIPIAGVVPFEVVPSPILGIHPRDHRGRHDGLGHGVSPGAGWGGGRILYPSRRQNSPEPDAPGSKNFSPGPNGPVSPASAAPGNRPEPPESGPRPGKNPTCRRLPEER